MKEKPTISEAKEQRRKYYSLEIFRILDERGRKDEEVEEKGGGYGGGPTEG